mgnify:CR=1 FL=1
MREPSQELPIQVPAESTNNDDAIGAFSCNDDAFGAFSCFLIVQAAPFVICALNVLVLIPLHASGVGEELRWIRIALKIAITVFAADRATAMWLGDDLRRRWGVALGCTIAAYGVAVLV